MKYRASMSIMASKNKGRVRMLLAKRNTKRWPCSIVTGAQGRNDDETPYKTIVREIKEECGVDECMFKQVFSLRNVIIDDEDDGIIVRAYLIFIDESTIKKIVRNSMGNGELKGYWHADAKEVCHMMKNSEWVKKLQPHCRELLKYRYVWDLIFHEKV